MTNEHKEPWTPGPWWVSFGSDPGIPDVRVFCDRDTPVADVLYTDRGPIANARLIAEAPAMAELLEEFVDAVLTHPSAGMLVVATKKAQALLSRARGEGRT